MERRSLLLSGIPVVIYGAPSDEVIVAVHGLFSSKDDPLFEVLARESSCQVITFDLPGHGDRIGQSSLPIWPPDAIGDTRSVIEWALTEWLSISLFAVGVGAYFALLSMRDFDINQIWLLAPVVDMEAMIRRMMAAAGVSDDELARAGTIVTQSGETLSIDQLTFAVENPVKSPLPSTYILQSRHDEVIPIAETRKFADSVGAQLRVLDEAEHWFHTSAQFNEIAAWGQGFTHRDS